MQCFLLPAKALGPFRLGSTLRECISELQFNSRDFKRVNTTFNINDETQNDIVLDIQTCGIYLRFDSIQQRLKLIDVYDLSKISIYYHKQLLTAPPSSSQESSPTNQNNKNKQKNKTNSKKLNQNTFARIYNIMGLTHPGYYDKLRSLYYVEYEGLWLSFILHYDPGPSSLPVDLNDGSSPILTRLIVFYGKNGFLAHQLPPLGQQLSMIQSHKTSPSHIHIYAYYFEPIYVTLNEGIKLGWRNSNILFGSSVQDVLSDIGPPYKIFYKRESRSHRKSIQNLNLNTKNHNDYFFNYIDLGLDILFDGNSHVIKKFILHTNCVGHPDFNRWCKCNFNIILFNDMNCVITSCSKWKDILKYMGSNIGSPIMYRSSHGKIQNVNRNKNKLNVEENEFNNHQSIKIYGYQSVLFEIMGNQSISTVTLFHEDNYQLRSPHIAMVPQGKFQRVHSIGSVFEDSYKLPEVSQVSSFHHHSRINPSPLSKSIEEAARSQLLIQNSKKQILKNKKRSKEKKRRVHSKEKRHKKIETCSSPQVAAVEIDNNICIQGVDRNNDNNEDIVDEDIVGNEMFDNIKL